jgi:uncharacterized membrane-anchored protein
MLIVVVAVLVGWNGSARRLEVDEHTHEETKETIVIVSNSMGISGGNAAAQESKIHFADAFVLMPNGKIIKTSQR